MNRQWSIVALGLIIAIAWSGQQCPSAGDEPQTSSRFDAARVNRSLGVRLRDCPQRGLTGQRNNAVLAGRVPTAWDVAAGTNVKWAVPLGSQTYSTPVIANGRVFVGTNNAHGYVARLPKNVDLGCLLAFEAESGKFLWQHSSEKLAVGRSQDWELLGVCSSAYVERKRLWYVTSRDQICCLDTEGFLDGVNDGPFREEPSENQDEADVVWKLDMIGRFGASPHNASCCSVTAAGDVLFVGTSNGVHEGHQKVAKPDAPSFVAVNKNTGNVLWTDRSPGANILHGQWSSPAYGLLGGVEQVIFAGGDAWLYSFDPRGENGQSKLLWKFDCNPKTAAFKLHKSARNPLLAMPVIHEGLVYIGVGEDPEHGEGPGHLWCVDPTRRGDVSPTIVFNKADPDVPIAPKRLQSCDPAQGDFERPNVNSALIWHYEGRNTKLFEETMHRTISSAVIKDNLLFITDENGLVHCLDAKTGNPHWTHDLLASSWSTPLVAGDKVYVADLDGKISIFELSDQKQLVAELDMQLPVYTTPVVANDVLYIAGFHKLFAIAEGALLRPDDDAKE